MLEMIDGWRLSMVLKYLQFYHKNDIRVEIIYQADRGNWVMYYLKSELLCRYMSIFRLNYLMRHTQWKVPFQVKLRKSAMMYPTMHLMPLTSIIINNTLTDQGGICYLFEVLTHTQRWKWRTLAMCRSTCTILKKQWKPFSRNSLALSKMAASLLQSVGTTP